MKTHHQLGDRLKAVADVLHQIQVEAVQAEVSPDDLSGLDEAIEDVQRVAVHLSGGLKKKRGA